MNVNALAVVICRDGVLPAGTTDAFGVAAGVGVIAGTGALSAASQLAGGSVQIAETPIRFGLLASAIATLPDVISTRMIVLPASPDGRDLAPALAALLGRPLITGVTRVRQNQDGSANLVAVRSDGLVDHLHTVTVPCVVTMIPATGHAAGAPSVKGDEAAANILPIDLFFPTTPTDIAQHDSVQSVAVLPPDPATMDLTEATCIVAGGNGLVSEARTGKDRFDTLREVGARIGASLGGTRVASDAGWIPFERQIGTTGVEVSPKVYLAFGISGATQHTSGLGSPDHILSVNTDPSCPMMAMAEVAIVADAFQVVQALHQLLAGTANSEIGEATKSGER